MAKGKSKPKMLGKPMTRIRISARKQDGSPGFVTKVVSAFKEQQDRSQYVPHQGKKELTRRLKQYDHQG